MPLSPVACRRTFVRSRGLRRTCQQGRIANRRRRDSLSYRRSYRGGNTCKVHVQLLAQGRRAITIPPSQNGYGFFALVGFATAWAGTGGTSGDTLAIAGGCAGRDEVAGGWKRLDVAVDGNALSGGRGVLEAGLHRAVCEGTGEERCYGVFTGLVDSQTITSHPNCMLDSALVWRTGPVSRPPHRSAPRPNAVHAPERCREQGSPGEGRKHSCGLRDP